ncbi:MAG TPA: DNA-3-methyladenine glycosylase 2 family protein [Actinomycetota bacterium]|nr:DNA-3-methyladenine glycosylase 2 family protein [Actinomycetota bacterium]
MAEILDEPRQTMLRLPLPVDLGLTLAILAHGKAHPCVRSNPDGSWWRATRTPLGPATTRFVPTDGGIRAEAWGPGKEWALDAAPELLGARDPVDGFDPAPGIVRDLHRRMTGLRIPRSRAVFEALAPTILEQKVPGAEAFASYRNLVRAFGETAPGPGGLRLPPSPEALARTPYPAFHPLGIERRRADTLRAAASRAVRLEETVGMPLPQAYRRIEAFPGVGPWSAARVAMVALGDADAVPLGDYHFPHMVAWAFIRRPRGSDEQMLELLEPFAGHRGRVLRLLLAAGVSAPRYGPRMSLRSIERI